MNYRSSVTLAARALAAVVFGAVCMVAVTACSEKLSGTYVSARDDDMVLELKSNGSFYIRGNAGGYAGKYTIDGTELFLKGDPGTAMKFTIRDKNTLVEDTGEVFLSAEGRAARQESQQQQAQARAATARAEQQRIASEKEKAAKPTREIARLPLRSGYANRREVVGEAILTDVSITVRQKQDDKNVNVTHTFDEVHSVRSDSFDVEPDSSTRRYLYSPDEAQRDKFFYAFESAWRDWQKKHPELVPPHRRPEPDKTPFRLPDSINN